MGGLESITVTRENIETLEFRANQAFEALKHAIRTGQERDAVYAHDIYMALGGLLTDITGEKPHWFGEMDRKKPNQLKRYIAQWNIGVIAAYVMAAEELRGKKDILGEVLTRKMAIEWVNDEGVSYFNHKKGLHQLSMAAAKVGKYDLIIAAIECARIKYQKPSLKE